MEEYQNIPVRETMWQKEFRGKSIRLQERELVEYYVGDRGSLRGMKASGQAKMIEANDYPLDHREEQTWCNNSVQFNLEILSWFSFYL